MATSVLRSTPLLLAMLAIGTVGCATGGERGDSSQRDLLTRSEIEEASPHIRNALEVVEQLRPHFLRGRPNPSLLGGGGNAPLQVRVYVDGSHWGSPSTLVDLNVGHVERIRYLRPQDAQTRYGMDHGGGVLEVATTGR